jgi:hypothetical protein
MLKQSQTLFRSGVGVFLAPQADRPRDLNRQGTFSPSKRQTAVLVLGTVTGVISREQNLGVLPLFDTARHNPASCRAKNTPTPDFDGWILIKPRQKVKKKRN